MNAPAKVQDLLDLAVRHGLTVMERWNQSTSSHASRRWVVSSPENKVYDDEVWIFWYPGTRGGRVTLARYNPVRTTYGTARKTTQTLTRRDARYWINDMGAALVRQRERDAAKEA